MPVWFFSLYQVKVHWLSQMCCIDLCLWQRKGHRWKTLHQFQAHRSNCFQSKPPEGKKPHIWNVQTWAEHCKRVDCGSSLDRMKELSDQYCSINAYPTKTNECIFLWCWNDLPNLFTLKETLINDGVGNMIQDTLSMLNAVKRLCLWWVI